MNRMPCATSFDPQALSRVTWPTALVKIMPCAVCLESHALGRMPWSACLGNARVRMLWAACFEPPVLCRLPSVCLWSPASVRMPWLDRPPWSGRFGLLALGCRPSACLESHLLWAVCLGTNVPCAMATHHPPAHPPATHPLPHTPHSPPITH